LRKAVISRNLRRKLGDADIPSHEVYKSNLPRHSGGPLYNFACLLLDGFIVGVQSAELLRVHRNMLAMPVLRGTGWERAGAPSRFPRRVHIRCEGIPRRNIWRLCERTAALTILEYFVRDSGSRSSSGSSGKPGASCPGIAKMTGALEESVACL